MKRFKHLLLVVLILTVALSFAGCRKKKPEQIEPIPAPSDSGMPTGPTDTEPQDPRMTEGDLSDLEIEERVNSRLQPVFYDFNLAEVRGDQIAALENNAAVMKEFPNVRVLIEGHCDERGSDEYNLALGDRRARASRDYLVSLGISADRMSTVSYGENQPFDPGHDEAAWGKNRRAHFRALRK